MTELLKNSKLSLLVAILVCLLAESCLSLSYFHPSLSAIPKVKDKGDIQVDASLGLNSHFTQFSLTGYYQYDSNHFLGVNACIPAVEKHLTLDSFNNHYSNYYEVMHGKVFVADEPIILYFGPALGYGKIKTTYVNSFRSLEYIRYSYKAFASMSTSFIDVGFGLQASGLSFFNFRDAGDQWLQGTAYEDDLTELEKNRNCLILQPTFNFGYGWKNIKLCSQLNMLVFLHGDNRFPYNQFFIGSSLSITIPYSFYNN